MANKVCPKCGEEYSDTYRKCPFCEEEAAITKGKRLRRGGKRSVKRQRKGGGALGIMLLLAVIIIAGVLSYIFFGDQIAGFMGIRTEDSLSGDLDSSVTGTAGEQDPATLPDDSTGEDDGTQTPPETTPLALDSPAEFTIPSGETGRVNVSGGTGEVTWSTSNEHVAVVERGAVTGVGGGTATITATSGEESVSCTVTVTGDPWVAPTNFKLNKSDFTISSEYPDPVQLKISGGEYMSATWSVDKPEIATVSDTGLVTRMGSGTATVTCVVDGQTLTCVVRCG